MLWLVLTICYGIGATECELRHWPEQLTYLQCPRAAAVLGPIWHPKAVRCAKILPEGSKPLAPPARGMVA